MTTSSPLGDVPDQPSRKPRRTSRDGGFTVWHSHTTDRWDARVAVGMTVLDLIRGLSIYLPGGVRLVDARPDDGSGMLLVFEPDNPDGELNRHLAEAHADMVADLATVLNLEAGLAAIVGTARADETSVDAADGADR